MSRHSGAFFGGDDISALPLHNDPHVGINMAGLDAHGNQHPSMSNTGAFPPSPSSMRSPHSSHGHASASTKYMQSPNSLNSANALDSRSANANANAYTSPRLHNSQIGAFGLGEPTNAQERYSFDNQQQQQQHLSSQHQQAQASAYRNEGLGRSHSMGHNSHPSQSRATSNAAASGSSMYLSPQSGAAQAMGSHSSSGHGSNGSGGNSGSYLSSLSPSGLRHSSFISGGGGGGASSATSPQGSYSGLPPLSSGSSHSSGLLPAPQMLSGPYSNPSSRRSSNAMDTSGSSIRDPASNNPYSPNTSHSSRFGNSNTSGSGRSGSHETGGANLMDVNSPREAPRSPHQQHQLSQQYTSSASASAICRTRCHMLISQVTISRQGWSQLASIINIATCSPPSKAQESCGRPLQETGAKQHDS